MRIVVAYLVSFALAFASIVMVQQNRTIQQQRSVIREMYEHCR